MKRILKLKSTYTEKKKIFIVRNRNWFIKSNTSLQLVASLAHRLFMLSNDYQLPEGTIKVFLLIKSRAGGKVPVLKPLLLLS